MYEEAHKIVEPHTYTYDFFTHREIPYEKFRGVFTMPNVQGIEFNSNQSELVKDLIRELLKDSDCVVYAVPNMKPNGELRMASQPPTSGPRRIGGGVFFRVKPGVHEATVIRPMNAKAGEQYMKVTKLSQADLLAIVRIWRKQTRSSSTEQNSVVAEVEKLQLVTV